MIDTLEKAEKERRRKEREDKIRTTYSRDVNLSEVDIFRIGEPYHDMTMEGRYVAWVLHKIDKIEDAELYWMMLESFYLEWEPTDYQKYAETNLLEGIRTRREMFGMTGFKYYPYSRLTAGDVLIHYAEELSRDIDCSLAFALELYFHNLGLMTNNIIMSDRYGAAIRQALSDFLKSDLEPGHATIFDAATYARGSYYMELEGTWDMMTWWDQYAEYLTVLQPVRAY